MKVLKRISMAGADVAVTDAELADLLLEYAMHLGRVGTTDIVAVPVARDGKVEEVDLLLGPASQIMLSESNDPDLEAVELPLLDEVRAKVREAIDRVTGRGTSAIEEDDGDDPRRAFVDFDTYL